MLCGVNPVTGGPGLLPWATGIPGQLRPGVGGRGDFGAPRRNRPHKGADVAGAVGSNVYNSYTGIVLTVGNDPTGFGNYIIVDIGNGYTMLYAHLQSGSIAVQVGEGVYYGQPIGLLGQTGNAAGQPASEAHVHFEVLNNGVPVDPALFLNTVCPWSKP